MSWRRVRFPRSGKDGCRTSTPQLYRENADTASLHGFVPTVEFLDVVLDTETVSGVIDMAMSVEIQFFW
jgi:hypothetical protein